MGLGSQTGGSFGPCVMWVHAGATSNSRLLVERYVALEALAPFVADEFVVKSDDVHDVAQILGRNLAFLPVSLRMQCDNASLAPCATMLPLLQIHVDIPLGCNLLCLMKKKPLRRSLQKHSSRPIG